MGDRPLPAILQLPLADDLRAGLEASIDKKLLSKEGDEGGRTAKEAQRRSSITTLKGGKGMKVICKSMTDKGALKLAVSVEKTKDVLDAVIEVVIRKANSILEAASSGPADFRVYLEKQIIEVSLHHFELSVTIKLNHQVITIINHHYITIT